jgi:hypothetical protein
MMMTLEVDKVFCIEEILYTIRKISSKDLPCVIDSLSVHSVQRSSRPYSGIKRRVASASRTQYMIVGAPLLIRNIVVGS